MSDMLQAVFNKLGAVETKLGAVETKIDNVAARGEEDRKDNGRHRENQRTLHNAMHHEIRSINDRVTRIEPIAEALHTQRQRKKFARDLAVRFGRTALFVGRAALFVASAFSGWALWFLGVFEKFGKMILSLLQ